MIMDLESRARFRNAIAVLNPRIVAFCLKRGYEEEAFRTFPSWGLRKSDPPPSFIEIELALEKFASNEFVFTPDCVFSISCGSTYQDGNFHYVLDGPFRLTYVTFSQLTRMIDRILRVADHFLSINSVEDVLAKGIRFDFTRCYEHDF